MRGKNVFDEELDELLVDDFGELGSAKARGRDDDADAEVVHRERWTIVDALDVLNDALEMSGFKKMKVSCAEAFEYLNNVLGFNEMQCVVLAMLVEEGRAMTLRQMGIRLGMSRLSMLT